MTGERYVSLNEIIRSLDTASLCCIRDTVTAHMHRFSSEPDVTQDAWAILDHLLSSPMRFERSKADQ